MNDTKICNYCKKTLPIDNFRAGRNDCKVCEKIKQKLSLEARKKKDTVNLKIENIEVPNIDNISILDNKNINNAKTIHKQYTRKSDKNIIVTRIDKSISNRLNKLAKKIGINKSKLLTKIIELELDKIEGQGISEELKNKLFEI